MIKGFNEKVRNFFIIIFFIIIAAFYVTSVRAQECPQYNHSNIRWKESPVTYKKINLFSSWDVPIDKAARDWSNIAPDVVDPDEGLILSDSGWVYDVEIREGTSPDVAEAQITIKNGYLNKVKIYVNPNPSHGFDSYFWYLGTSGTPGDNEISLYSVMLHEFGHALGLNHVEVDANGLKPIMYESIDPGEMRYITCHDIYGLRDLYSPSGGSGGGICKPALGDFSQAQGLASWIYVLNMARSENLLGKPYSQIFQPKEREILRVLSQNPSLKARFDRFVNDIGREMHQNLAQGKGIHVELTDARIAKFDSIIEGLKEEIDFDPMMDNFRLLLKRSAGKSFWHLFSDLSYSALQYLPSEPKLHKNIPNPFNPITTIGFEIPEASFVYLNIYDNLGQLIKNLVAEYKDIGVYHVTWNGKDNLNKKAASGIYIYQLEIPSLSYIKNEKMLLIK